MPVTDSRACFAGSAGSKTFGFRADLEGLCHLVPGRSPGRQPGAGLSGRTSKAGERPPAAALDAWMGQGRNALYLSQTGWKVTGFDISDVGISAARASAEKNGLRIITVKASYDAFDY